MIKYFLLPLILVFSSTVFAQNYPYIPLVKNTVTETPVGNLSNKTIEKTTETNIGSGIQWNAEYMVTAKHNNFIENDVVYRCPASCDIMFVKHSANGVFPAWRQANPNENVIIVGNNIDQKTVAAKGKDMNLRINTQTSMDIDLYTTTAQTEGGMSGGPVYGDDDKVIGMLVSSIELNNQVPDFKKLTNNKAVSAYVSYNDIRTQWLIYETNLFKNKALPTP